MNLPCKSWLWTFGAAIAFWAFSIPLMAADSVVVGVVHRENFAYANMMRTAYEMALEEINATGGINGRPLALVFADDGGDVKVGGLAISELALEKKAVMLVGGYSSSNTLEMAYAADRLDIPFLVCTAADDRITQHGLKNIYRLNPPALGYTKGLEEFLISRVKPESMSIVYENSPFGTGSAMRMMWFCRENGITIKAIQPYFKNRASLTYFHRLLIPIQKDAPEVLFMVSYLEDATLLVKKIGELQIKSLLCGGAGGFTHDDFSRSAGNASEYMLTATLWSAANKGFQAKDFSDRFTKRHSQKPDYHAAEAYSALMVVAEVLRKSSSVASSDIRTALDAINMDTPFGKVQFLDYGPFRRQNVSKTQVLQVINSQFETIWPKDLATAEFAVPLR